MNKMIKKLIIMNVTSTFHTYGEMSYLLENKLIDDENDFLILSNYHPPSGKFRVNEKDFNIINNNCEFIKVTNGWQGYIAIHDKLKSKKYNDVILLNPMDQNYVMSFIIKYVHAVPKIKEVLVDEGIGMYFTNNLWKLEIDIQRTGSKIQKLFSKIKDKIRIILSLAIMKILKNLEVEEYFLFKNIDNSLELQNHVANGYLSYFTFKKNNDFFVSELTYNTILIVSDNLSLYLNDQQEEASIYTELINQIKSKYPTSNVLIKAHPNESQNMGKFNCVKNCKVLNKDISIEELLNNNEIELLVGFCSTSLLLSSQVFNVETLSLVDYLDEKKLTSYGVEKIKTFKILTKKFKKLKFRYEER